jgi:hypothetical protein
VNDTCRTSLHIVTGVLGNFAHHIQNRFWNLSVFLLEGMVLRLNRLFEEMSVVAISEVCRTMGWKEVTENVP